MAEARFDLVVVGSGPGGYIAAIRAAQLGMRVACVERYPTLGGTCLNVGCIPSKALLDSSEHYHTAQHGLATHGVTVEGVGLDLAAMMKRKDRVVRALTQGVVGLLKKNTIERVTGAGTIKSATQVAVSTPDGERLLETTRILIATGSKPTPLPALPFDGERIVSSTEALKLGRVPERMLVIGAGAVGLELGSVWSRLGATVTVVEFLDRIVPAMDRKMGAQLQAALKKQGLIFKLGTKATGFERTEVGVRITLDAEGESSVEEADVVLVAVGRRPYTEGLGLETVGVTCDARGFVGVNARFETSIPGIFAIGDVIGGVMLAHKAEDEGVAAVEMMAGHAAHVNYEAIPNVVYTWPEFASVGLSEEQATAEGKDFTLGAFPFMANGRARCMNETDGGVKILADTKTDRIIGLHILGPRASDLIAEAAVAVEFCASAEDLARSAHAHPTLPEAIKEAALAVGKRALNI